MENIDNMAKNSLETLSRENLSYKAKKKLTIDIICGTITLTFLAVGLIYTYLLGNKYPILPQLFYFAGFLIEGIPVIIMGLKGIFTKKLTNAMEILVAIAILACVFNKELILALLIPLILNIVHLIEERSIMGGRDVIEGLKKMQQNKACLLVGDKEVVVDAKDLKIGEKIIVNPGMGIPVDGVIIEGKTHIDEKSLTGEPLPTFFDEGKQVYAGTINLEGRIVVEVQREYIDTSFSKILNLLEKSENIVVPETGLMDKFLSYYIPFVLGLAAVIAILTHDISKFVAVLVVSCPCGYMLVNSAPMIAALSVATKRGILIKNSKFIEELTEIDTVVFDKTGTVTKGELSLTDIVTASGILKEDLISIAASLSTASNHPVSVAVKKYVTENNIKYKKIEDVKEIQGKGIEGINSNDDTIRFGREEWLEESGCLKNYQLNCEGSASFIAVNEKIIGYIRFNDVVRDGAEKSIASLRSVGAEHIVMLTGDSVETANKIGKIVGINEVYGKLLPQDKLEKIKELKKDDKKILAIGDGINDALALREANVGIAMGAMGSDLAIDSADIALMNNNLNNIYFIYELAKRTRKIVYQNMILSICISLFMISISAFGIITPIMGAVFHNVGAFSVLLNSSRIITLKI